MTSNREEHSILPKKRKDAPLVTTSNVFEGSLFTSVTEQDFKECRITPDNKISVYDVFVKITGGTAKQARKYFENIIKHPKNGSLKISIETYQFEGEGFQKTPVAEYHIILRLLALLPKKFGQNSVMNRPNCMLVI